MSSTMALKTVTMPCENPINCRNNISKHKKAYTDDLAKRIGNWVISRTGLVGGGRDRIGHETGQLNGFDDLPDEADGEFLVVGRVHRDWH